MDLRESTRPAARRHPWEVARFRFFSGLLDEAGVLADTRRVLDVGAGDAWFAQQLRGCLPAGAHIDCVDTGYADATALPGTDGLVLHAEVPNGTWDLVLLLDVLEHVVDDLGMLGPLVRDAVRPGGHVLISVPAWQALFTHHDTFLGHHRRYAPGQARALVGAAGLTVVQSGGLFHSLLAPRLLAKVRETVRPAAADGDPAITWRHGAAVTKVVQAALGADLRVSRWLARAGVEVPGLTWWALCRKQAIL